ncbi:class I SAM-dependent methyltransferase [Solidesulfovibrio sp.]|uniref:class I SAM-dependent methyltransferase n=1 Tax=Solidesulfovibrio sp. TaxID=2910990 RepID=UPI002B1ED44E|nr:class I SAM-dependent methyltransferase [Solidesulfovibrio sp.]MEA5088426.1 class I SAM-dependent methyltransferase [Solidesulfovibrio sp.]
MPENAQLPWRHTHCVLCGLSAGSRELFPARLGKDSFTPQAFSARRLREREHYRIVACDRCGLIRSDPIIDEAFLASLYGESGFLFSSEEGRLAATYGDLLRRLLTRYADGPAASLLEIGCSTGFFLGKAMELGIPHVMGFEPSRECAAQAPPAVAARIVVDMFRPERLEGRLFDVVCSFHVLDHLTRPDLVLEQAAAHLRPGGTALMVCHDARSLTARLLRDHSPIFDVEHIYLFDRTTLPKLFEKAGMEVLECGQLANTFSLSYWLRLLPMGGRLEKLAPRSLTRLPVTLRAGNLYILARKP